MKKLIAIFGAILFASVMMTSCGAKEVDSMEDTSGQAEGNTKKNTDTDMSWQDDYTTKTNIDTITKSSLINDDSEDNSLNSKNKTSILEKDAISYANLLCEMKEIQDRLENAESEDEFNKATADLDDLEQKYKSFMNYMQDRYPDETSEEVLEIKNLLKPLLLHCYSEHELERIFAE